MPPPLPVLQVRHGGVPLFVHQKERTQPVEVVRKSWTGKIPGQVADVRPDADFCNVRHTICPESHEAHDSVIPLASKRQILPVDVSTLDGHVHDVGEHAGV